MTCSSSTTFSPDAAPQRLRAGRRVRAALLLAALALPLVLQAAPGTAQQAASAASLDAARGALARGDGIDAEMKLRAALTQGASHRQVAALMGCAYLAQADYDKAREWLGPGDFSPESAEQGWRGLGMLERLTGNLPASGRAYDHALALNPEDAGLWVDIGRLRYAGGEHVLAIEAARHALQLDPRNVRALEFGGELARDRYGLLAAVPWFEQAILQAPKDVSVLLGYAATLGELGRASEALTVTRRILELSPKNPQAYYLQAVIAARAGNYELSRALLVRTRGKLDRQPAVQLLNGLLELTAGNAQAAGEALEAVLRVRPDYMPAKELLAQSIYRSGRYRYLTLRFSADLADENASPYLLTIAARSYEIMGDRLQAGKLLDRAAMPNASVVTIRRDEGAIGELLALGSTAAAENMAESARTSNPGFFDSQALAGDVQLALGRGGAAERYYEAAAAIRMSPSLFERRFEAFALSDDRAGAATLVEGYLRQNPTSRSAQRAAATLAIASGDLPRARSILIWLRDTGDAGDVRLLADLAMVDAGLGNPEAARINAQDAYRLQRSSPLATQALGYGYAVSHGFREQARALLDKAQAMIGGTTPLIVQARALVTGPAAGSS